MLPYRRVRIYAITMAACSAGLIIDIHGQCALCITVHYGLWSYILQGSINGIYPQDSDCCN